MRQMHTRVNNIVQLIFLVLFSAYLFNYPLTLHKSRTFHEYSTEISSSGVTASRCCCESGTLWTLGCHSRSFFTWKPPSSPVQVQNAPPLWEMHERQRRRSWDAVTRKVAAAGEQMAREEVVEVVPFPAVRQERNAGWRWNILSIIALQVSFATKNRNKNTISLIAWSWQAT